MTDTAVSVTSAPAATEVISVTSPPPIPDSISTDPAALTPEQIAEKAIADEAAKEAAEAKALADEQAAKDKAEADALAAAQKAAHIVSVVAGKPSKGIAEAVGNDGTPIPRDGPLTIALVTTLNPQGMGTNPGTDINCVARLPAGSEIGDTVAVFCTPAPGGTSVFLHPPKGESIGPLPVSTGDNVGTGVEVSAVAGRSFHKVSATSWQALGA